jgi:hypothetical protein
MAADARLNAFTAYLADFIIDTGELDLTGKNGDSEERELQNLPSTSAPG